MEILKRAKGISGEIIPCNANEKDVREEINRRTWKAGYTDRDGRQKISREDAPRPCNTKKYRENYERIFGHD